jgi:hypothetical protein
LIAIVLACRTGIAEDRRALAVDCGLTSVFSIDHSRVHQSQDGALAFVSKLETDVDGAPNAYSPRGRPAGALDTLCNAGKSITSDGRISYFGSEKGACGKFLHDVELARAGNWIGSTQIEWFGLVTTDCENRIPFVQPSGRFQGYYLSRTTLEDPRFEKFDQRRYLDARVVPYLVLPRASEFSRKFDVAVADLAVSYYTRNRKIVASIVGDLGPSQSLGEGSVALNAKLLGRNLDVDTMTSKDIAQLRFLAPVLTVVFAKSRLKAPYSQMRIDEAGLSHLAIWGGAVRLLACAKTLGILRKPQTPKID